MAERIAILSLAIIAAVASLLLKSKVTIIISNRDAREMSNNYFRAKAKKLTTD